MWDRKQGFIDSQAIRSRSSYRENAHRNFPLSHQSVGIVLGYQKRIPKSGVVPLQAQRDMWSDVPSLSTCSPSLGKDKPLFIKKGKRRLIGFVPKCSFRWGPSWPKTYVFPTVQKGEPKRSRWRRRSRTTQGSPIGVITAIDGMTKGPMQTLVGPEGDRRTVEFPMREGSREVERGTWYFASRASAEHATRLGLANHWA